MVAIASKMRGFILKEIVSMSQRIVFIFLFLLLQCFFPLPSLKSLTIAWPTAFSCFIGFGKDLLFPAITRRLPQGNSHNILCSTSLFQHQLDVGSLGFVSTLLHLSCNS